MKLGGASSFPPSMAAMNPGVVFVFNELHRRLDRSQKHVAEVRELLQSEQGRLSQMLIAKAIRFPPRELLPLHQLESIYNMRRRGEESSFAHEVGVFKDIEQLLESVYKFGDEFANFFANKNKDLLHEQEYTEEEYQIAFDIWIRILDVGTSFPGVDDLYSVLQTYPRNLKKEKPSSKLHLIVGDQIPDNLSDESNQRQYKPKRPQISNMYQGQMAKNSMPAQGKSMLSQNLTQIMIIAPEDAIQAITGSRIKDDDELSLPEIQASPAKKTLRIIQANGTTQKIVRPHEPKTLEIKAPQLKVASATAKRDDSAQKSVSSKISESTNSRIDGALSGGARLDSYTEDQRVSKFLQKRSANPEDIFMLEKLRKESKWINPSSLEKLNSIYASLKWVTELLKALGQDEGPEDFEEMVESASEEILKLPGPGQEGFKNSLELLLKKYIDFPHTLSPVTQLIANIKMYYWNRQMEQLFDPPSQELTNEQEDLDPSEEQQSCDDPFQMTPKKAGSSTHTSATKLVQAKKQGLSMAAVRKLMQRAPEICRTDSKWFELATSKVNQLQEFRDNLKSLISSLVPHFAGTTVQSLPSLDVVRSLQTELNTLLTIQLDPIIAKFVDLKNSLKQAAFAELMLGVFELLHLLPKPEQETAKVQKEIADSLKMPFSRYKQIVAVLEEHEYEWLRKQEIVKLLSREVSGVQRALSILQNLNDSIKRRAAESVDSTVENPFVAESKPIKPKLRAYQGPIWECRRKAKLGSVQNFFKCVSSILNTDGAFREVEELLKTTLQQQEQFQSKLSELTKDTYPVISGWPLEQIRELNHKIEELREEFLRVNKLHVPVFDELACWEWLLDTKMLLQNKLCKPLPDQLQELCDQAPNHFQDKAGSKPGLTNSSEQGRTGPPGSVFGHVQQMKESLCQMLESSKEFKSGVLARLQALETKQPSSIQIFECLNVELGSHPIRYPWLFHLAAVGLEEHGCFRRQLDRLFQSENAMDLCPTFEELVLVFHWAKKLRVAISVADTSWNSLLERLYACQSLIGWIKSGRASLFEVKQRYAAIPVEIAQVDQWIEEMTNKYRETSGEQNGGWLTDPVWRQRLQLQPVEAVGGQTECMAGKSGVQKPGKKEALESGGEPGSILKSKEFKLKLRGLGLKSALDDTQNLVGDLEKLAREPPKLKDWYGVELKFKEAKRPASEDWLELFWMCLKDSHQQLTVWLLVRKPPLEILQMVLEGGFQHDVSECVHLALLRESRFGFELTPEQIHPEFHQKHARTWIVPDPVYCVAVDPEFIEKEAEETSYITWLQLNPPPPIVEEEPPVVLEGMQLEQEFVEQRTSPVVPDLQDHLTGNHVLGKQDQFLEGLEVPPPSKKVLTHLTTSRNPKLDQPLTTDDHQFKQPAQSADVPSKPSQQVESSKTNPSKQKASSSKKIPVAIQPLRINTRRTSNTIAATPILPVENSPPKRVPIPVHLRLSVDSTCEKPDAPIESLRLDIAVVEQKVKKAVREQKKKGKKKGKTNNPEPILEPLAPCQQDVPISTPNQAAELKSELALEEIAGAAPISYPVNFGVPGSVNWSGGLLRPAPSNPEGALDLVKQSSFLTTAPETQKYQETVEEELQVPTKAEEKNSAAKPTHEKHPHRVPYAQRQALPKPVISTQAQQFIPESFGNLDRQVDETETMDEKTKEQEALLNEEDQLLERAIEHSDTTIDLADDQEDSVYNLNWEDWVCFKKKEYPRDSMRLEEYNTLTSLSTESTRKPSGVEYRMNKPHVYKGPTEDAEIELPKLTAEQITIFEEGIKKNAKQISVGIWEIWRGTLMVSKVDIQKRSGHVLLAGFNNWLYLQTFAKLTVDTIHLDKIVSPAEFQTAILNEIPAFQAEQKQWASGMLVPKGSSLERLAQAPHYIYHSSWESIYNTKLYLLRPTVLEKTGLEAMVERYSEIKEAPIHVLIWIMIQDKVPRDSKLTRVRSDGYFFESLPEAYRAKSPNIKHTGPKKHMAQPELMARPGLAISHRPIQSSRNQGGISRQAKLGTDGMVSGTTGEKFQPYPMLAVPQTRVVSFATPDHLGKRAPQDELQFRKAEGEAALQEMEEHQSGTEGGRHFQSEKTAQEGANPHTSQQDN